MAESMESLHRRGMISQKQMARMSKSAILKKTKHGVPSKMAIFSDKSSSGTGTGLRGEVPTNEINHRTNQKTGTPARAGGLPSRGGQARGGTAPRVDSIDQGSLQRPKFPPGASVKGAYGKKQVGVRGGVKPSAPSQYGGPSNRKYG